MLAAAGLMANPYGTGYLPYDYRQPTTSNVSPVGGGGNVIPPTSIYGASPQTLATDTAASNLNAAGDITSLTNLINNLNAQNQQMLNASRLGPGGQTVQNQLLTNAGAQAAGQLPADVVNNALALGAQSGAGRGFGVDDPATNAAVKRALGLDTVALNQMGQQNYLGLLAANPSAPLWGGQNNLVTPGLYATTADAQARLQLQNQQFQEEMALEYAKLAAAQRAGAGRGGGGYGPATAAVTGARSASFPTTYPGGGIVPGTGVGTPYDYSMTPGGASAAASGGDRTYQDWAQWFDPFGFGDWSMGGPATTTAGAGLIDPGYGSLGWDLSTNWLTGQPANPYFDSSGASVGGMGGGMLGDIGSLMGGYFGDWYEG